jgi:heptosyltransferase-2
MNQTYQSKEQPLPPEVKQRWQRLRPARKFQPVPGPAPRLLVRTPNWVGDAIMSLPVLSGLVRLFPQAEITILAARRVSPLFLGLPGVAEVIPYPAGREKWRVLWGLRGRFHLAVTLANSLESALGLWLLRAPVRLGYAADARGPLLKPAVSGRRDLAGLHTVFYYLGLLKTLGEVESFSPPALYLREEESAAAAKLLSAAGSGSGPWVGLSPGAAYGPAKRWPPERFAALGRELAREFGARLVLLGGPGEARVANQVKAQLGLPVLDLTGKTDLRQALAVLSRLNLLVTNDSGLMHAAAALGVPLVAVFGSTDPAATGPFTPRATVLHRPLPCSPCRRRTCNLGYPCLTAIGVEEVLAAARPWLTEPVRSEQ